MTTFLIVAALLTAAALLFVLPTLLRGASGEAPHASRDQVNLTVLRDQLRELDADLAAGTISGVSYDGARQELELRVAEDVQPGQPLP
ncbi:MAG: c-type cytochrome biogenesis protein CcmI, partial [Telluria sp.]